jgi:hypothetical protein
LFLDPRVKPGGDIFDVVYFSKHTIRR